MKVAKEEIVGLVAAIDWFLKQDDAAMEAECRERADRIAKHLSTIPTVQTQTFIPESPIMFRTCSSLTTRTGSRSPAWKSCERCGKASRGLS